jgi:NAD(P)-dependent dehydrogenase (short-subunit alcohol dehydrogenase family)
MVARGYGRVVVIASVAAKRGEPYLAAYTASKHGVLGLVRSVAAEVGGVGGHCQRGVPGYVDTPMTESSVRSISERTAAASTRREPSSLPSSRTVASSPSRRSRTRCGCASRTPR